MAAIAYIAVTSMAVRGGWRAAVVIVAFFVGFYLGAGASGKNASVFDLPLATVVAFANGVVGYIIGAYRIGPWWSERRR
jgi:hypothetical protein